MDWAGLGDGGAGAVVGRLACGDQAATFGDAAGGEFPLRAAPKAASDAVTRRFASLARGVLALAAPSAPGPWLAERVIGNLARELAFWGGGRCEDAVF